MPPAKMSLFSSLHTSLLTWWQDVPLPSADLTGPPIFQSWHEFDAATQKWTPISATASRPPRADDPAKLPSDPDSTCSDPGLNLVTWNVDASTYLPGARISAIVSHILSLTPAADVVFFQEVSRPALAALLETAQIRQAFFSTEADDASSWERAAPFANITLLSKSRFGYPRGGSAAAVDGLRIGPVWRVRFPSRFGRDALCCDVLLDSSGRSRLPSTREETAAPSSRIRLINVHLDLL